ncbi:LapB repeat-containing protein [Listeria marthii]|uniref:LapB repeat-containing protein n=1 Tax=Listeria marthii TaxID=529731 RepID=UPI002880A323|nr:LapB repeat-containing protein [Listeria marthii]MDT0092025.1 LapB repeat-containing protein [Listeria marthii]
MKIKKNLHYLITLNLAFLAVSTPVYAKEDNQSENYSAPETTKSSLKNSPSNAAETLSTIFPDDVLANYIANQLHISVDVTVTQQQLDTIKTISADNAGIADLTGISRLSNLTSINLPNNAITTIDEIKNLTKLTSVILNNNQITAISGLENLDALTKLNMRDNQLTSVSLDSMSNLQFADFQGNTALLELSCINLPKMSQIYSDNAFSYSGVIMNSSILEKLTVKNLPNLSDLVFSELSLQSVELNDLPLLTMLDLRNNHLADIAMGNISTLKTLYLTGNELNDDDIASYTQANLKLGTLSIGRNDLSQIDYLRPLDNLQVLRISSTNISDLSPLQGKDMTELYIDNTPITSVEPLSSMSNLTKIEAFKTHITNVDNFENLDKLTTFLLQDNLYLQKVELDGLDALKQLDLENCTALTDLTMKNLAKASRFYDFKEANSDITIANTPNLQKVTLESLPALAGSISITNRELLADITIKDTPQITQVNLDNNNLTAFPDITGISPTAFLIRAQSNHISSIEEADIADDLQNNKNLSIDLHGQKVTSDPAKNIDNVATIQNQINAWGNTPAPQTISNNGHYADGSITWNNLPDSVESTSYTFSTANVRTSFSGTVTVPIVKALPAPIISANPEISYAKNSSVTEAEFLSDISASTTDGSSITSDFATAVDLSSAGDYQVTLNASNADGISAVPVQVTVHVEKAPAPMISADSEISYDKLAEVTEEMFLQDIHASTNDDSVITSNFDVAVNLEVPGDYQVTLNSTNSDGVAATPFQVTVHIKTENVPLILADKEISYSIDSTKSETDFLNEVHASTSDNSKITTDFEAAVDFSKIGDYQVTLESGLAEPVYVIVHIVETPTTNKTDLATNDVPLTIKSEPVNQKSVSTLPITGDSTLNNSLLVTLGITIVVSGVYLLRRVRK